MVQIQALQSLYEYLLDAENQLGADSINNNVNEYPKDATKSVPVAVGEADTNIYWVGWGLLGYIEIVFWKYAWM